MKKFGSFVFMILLGTIVSSAASWSYPTSAIEDPKGITNLDIRDGSMGKPYTISTAQELANFAYYVNNHSTGAAYKGKYVKLTADIVLNDWVINENGEIIYKESSYIYDPVSEHCGNWSYLWCHHGCEVRSCGLSVDCLRLQPKHRVRT